jgi:hypothetical protein
MEDDQMDNDSLLKEVISRLDVLIALQIETLGGPEAARPTTKIQRLSGLGLSPSEVAAIVGKPTNYVTAILSRQKKVRKRKEGKK